MCLLQKLEEVEWMRYRLQVGACLGPDFALWLTTIRPGAYLLQNSFMMLIKSMNTFWYEIGVAQGLSGKVVCTEFGEFSLYKLKAWHRTWVSAVEMHGVCVLILRCIHTAPSWLCSQVLFSYLFTLHFGLFGANELVPSSKPVCNILCLKFPVKWCECVPCWNRVLLPSTVFQLCTVSETLLHASMRIKLFTYFTTSYNFYHSELKQHKK